MSTDTSNKIDMVYLWCDGNDPEFIKRKAYFQSNGQVENITKVTGDVRFWDNEELRYSLRSLEKYAPWVNHVYIITDRQVPKWLDTDYEKVTVIDHSQIMPKECIPCFNSNVIEYFLPYIPALSEIFLYANDDMFFCSPVSPSDFIDNDKPIIRLLPYNRETGLKKYIKTIMRFIGLKYFREDLNPVTKAYSLLKTEYAKVEALSIHHNIDVYSKSAYLETLRKFDDEFKNTNMFRFRNKNCIHRIIFALDAIYSGKATYKLVKEFTGLSKMFVDLNKQEVFSYLGKEYHLNRLRKVIKNNNPKLFCLNAGEKATKEIKLEAKKFMEEMYPTASRFEK